MANKWRLPAWVVPKLLFIRQRTQSSEAEGIIYF